MGELFLPVGKHIASPTKTNERKKDFMKKIPSLTEGENIIACVETK